jgi:MFS transporter, DHA3 family, macrolide efflux protein
MFQNHAVRGRRGRVLTLDKATSYGIEKGNKLRFVKSQDLTPLTPSHKLFNRNFNLLIVGQSLSVLGSELYSVVLVLYLKRMTESAAVLGTVEMLSFLPLVLLGPLAGALVDRTSRKTVIVWSDLLRGILLMLLCVFSLDYFLNLKVIDIGIVQIHFSAFPFPVYAVFAVTLLIGVIDSAFNSALNVITPEILTKDVIQKGNSVFQGVGGALGIVGNALGGILFAKLGGAFVILIRGISHLSTACVSLFLSVPHKASPDDGQAFSYKGFITEVKEGFLFIWANNGLRNQTVINMLSNLLFPMVMLGLPFLVTDVMKLDDAFYGYLLSVITLSSIVGYVAFGSLRTTEKQNYVVICGIFFIKALLFLLLSVTTHVFLVFILFAALSSCMAISRLINTSLKQKVIPAKLRGRIFGTENSINGALVPLSFAFGGIIIDLLHKNILLLFLIIFVLYAVLAMMFVLSGTIRQFYLTSPPDEG